MANYDKQVEQEAAYPIPLSLYNGYRTVRHEKRYISGVYSYASLVMPHCPVTVVQRYRDIQTGKEREWTSVLLRRWAGHFGASYKALFMHLT